MAEREQAVDEHPEEHDVEKGEARPQEQLQISVPPVTSAGE